MKHPPALVCALCYGHDAWIVGGGARDDDPKDWDVLVPFSEWHAASFLIPPDARPNTFGGFKCKVEGTEIDVWPGDVGRLMTYGAGTHLWHLRTDFRWVRKDRI